MSLLPFVVVVAVSVLWSVMVAVEVFICTSSTETPGSRSQHRVMAWSVASSKRNDPIALVVLLQLLLLLLLLLLWWRVDVGVGGGGGDDGGDVVVVVMWWWSVVTAGNGKWFCGLV